MDYQTQQFRLLPLLASTYALIMTGVAMMMMFMQVRGEMAEGNLESLPEVSSVVWNQDWFSGRGCGYTITRLSELSQMFLPHPPHSLFSHSSCMLPVLV